LSNRFSRSFTLGFPYCETPLRAAGALEFPSATLSFTGSETDRRGDLRLFRATEAVGWRGFAVLVGMLSAARSEYPLDSCGGPLYSL
jgi:hypothetical protein